MSRVTGQAVRTCAQCSEPATLRGWLLQSRSRQFSLRSRWTKRYYWLCQRHYLEMMFNLRPYHCASKACARRRRHAGRGNTQEPVWIDLVSALVPAVSKQMVQKLERARQSVPLKSAVPRCPWCALPMKSVPVNQKEKVNGSSKAA